MKPGWYSVVTDPAGRRMVKRREQIVGHHLRVVGHFVHGPHDPERHLVGVHPLGPLVDGHLCGIFPDLPVDSHRLVAVSGPVPEGGHIGVGTVHVEGPGQPMELVVGGHSDRSEAAVKGQRGVVGGH